MKTILRGLALAAIFAAAGALWPGYSNDRGVVFPSPGTRRSPETRLVGGVPIRGQVLHGGWAVPGASVAFLPDQPGRRDVLITAPAVWRATTGADGRRSFRSPSHRSRSISSAGATGAKSVSANGKN